MPSDHLTTHEVALDRPTISVEDAAKVLGISRGSAFNAVSTGELPSIRVGRRILVPTAALRRMLALDPS